MTEVIPKRIVRTKFDIYVFNGIRSHRPIDTTIHGKCKRHDFFNRKLTRMDSDS